MVMSENQNITEGIMMIEGMGTLLNLFVLVRFYMMENVTHIRFI